MEQETPDVVIVGSGPAGLSAAASLAALRIPSLVLEKDDCVAPLWRKRTYDCLRLHLSKDRSELPHFPHPPATPTFISRDGFLRYLDGYADEFGIRPLLRRLVESAAFDEGAGKWRVVARNLESGEEEEYVARYLVVASGQNGAEVVPELPGMESFGGAVMHSSLYRSGKGFEGKDVLVVGGGNSGMEIALDLHKSGARSSIVVRSKGDNFLFGDDGMCKQKHPNYWKGQNGLYCTGLARKGLYGCAVDSLNIAEDINGLMNKSGARVSSGRS